MRILVLSALLMALSCPSFAAAKDSAIIKKGAHNKPASATSTVRPVYETTGAFGFCIADQSYADGRKLTVALSPHNQINIGLDIPHGGFKAGAKYDLVMILGEENKRSVRATALDNETLLLQMGASSSFRKKLTRSRFLTAGAGSKMIRFDLPEMGGVFKALTRCLKEKAGTHDPKQAQAEQLMPETLKALLITSGFTDIVPIKMFDVPVDERPADYIWKTGNLLAGVRERAVPENKTLSDLIGLHLQGLKEKCSGRFRAEVGREQSENDLHLRLAEATCSPSKKQEEKAITVTLLFYKTRAGDFVAFTHEAPSPHKDEALAARDKLAAGLLSLARR